jgi:hypothetical protein
VIERRPPVMLADKPVLLIVITIDVPEVSTVMRKIVFPNLHAMKAKLLQAFDEACLHNPILPVARDVIKSQHAHPSPALLAALAPRDGDAAAAATDAHAATAAAAEAAAAAHSFLPLVDATIAAAADAAASRSTATLANYILDPLMLPMMQCTDAFQDVSIVMDTGRACIITSSNKRVPKQWRARPQRRCDIVHEPSMRYLLALTLYGITGQWDGHATGHTLRAGGFQTIITITNTLLHMTAE